MTTKNVILLGVVLCVAGCACSKKKKAKPKDKTCEHLQKNIENCK